MTPPVPTGRFAAFDRLRGLMMVLMAVDHASYFIARAHAAEYWAFLPPFYASHQGGSVTLSFVTRWISHLCAPGFSMLMGAGMVWLSQARQQDGWSPARIRRFFVTRGLILLVIQHLIENPAWLLGDMTRSPALASVVVTPGGGSAFFLHFGVISGLAVGMIFWSFLIEAPSAVVVAISGVALAASVYFTPRGAEVATLFPLWRLLAFVPSHANRVNVLYPFVPWLAPAGLGILLARVTTMMPDKTLRWAAATGVALLVGCAGLRSIGAGDAHPPLPGFIGFLSLTKYPPSLAFFAATLGVDLLLLVVLLLTAAARWLKPLEVFGRSPLFFYLLHLYLFSVTSFAFPGGASFPMMYAWWAIAIVVMYPACRWYGRFKASTAVTSPWRLL